MFFFFKQKTAYEMRISDWSSDVCSSDLAQQAGDDPAREALVFDHQDAQIPVACAIVYDHAVPPCAARMSGRVVRNSSSASVSRPLAARIATASAASQASCRSLAMSPSRPAPTERAPPFSRSEEHTSELQSLMRISYAVFCLK